MLAGLATFRYLWQRPVCRHLCMAAALYGMASDYLQPRFGNDSLRYAILAVVVISTAWAALHFLLATKTIRQDLGEAEQPL